MSKIVSGESMPSLLLDTCFCFSSYRGALSYLGTINPFDQWWVHLKIVGEVVFLLAVRLMLISDKRNLFSYPRSKL